MWVWDQREGTLRRNSGEIVARGYAGSPEGKNLREKQAKVNVGPIPVGLYKIGPALRTTKLGPIIFALTPDPGNEMFGRSEFMIHWDSRKKPGAASQGCIVLVMTADGLNPLRVFQLLEQTPDRMLAVV